MQKEYYGNDACNSVDELNLNELCPLDLDSQDYDLPTVSILGPDI